MEIYHSATEHKMTHCKINPKKEVPQLKSPPDVPSILASISSLTSLGDRIRLNDRPIGCPPAVVKFLLQKVSYLILSWRGQRGIVIRMKLWMSVCVLKA